MDHLAIMNKSWGMIPKILSGEKTIESRWYVRKRPTFDLIQEGDAIYYKNSGELVIAKTDVSEVLKYQNLNPQTVLNLLLEYGKRIGIPPDQFERFYESYSGKKYCLLIFLKNPIEIKPFEVDKKKLGYCARSAWIDLESIEQIRIT